MTTTVKLLDFILRLFGFTRFQSSTCGNYGYTRFVRVWYQVHIELIGYIGIFQKGYNCKSGKKTRNPFAFFYISDERENQVNHPVDSSVIFESSDYYEDYFNNK